MTMDQATRERILRENRAAQDELQRDIKARRERRLSGDINNDSPPLRQASHGVREVARSIQPQRNASDEAMNLWFSASFDNHAEALRRDSAESIASHNQLVDDVEKEIDAIRKDNL